MEPKLSVAKELMGLARRGVLDKVPQPAGSLLQRGHRGGEGDPEVPFTRRPKGHPGDHGHLLLVEEPVAEVDRGEGEPVAGEHVEGAGRTGDLETRNPLKQVEEPVASDSEFLATGRCRARRSVGPTDRPAG